jgi:hypothetical protein
MALGSRHDRAGSHPDRGRRRRRDRPASPGIRASGIGNRVVDSTPLVRVGATGFGGGGRVVLLQPGDLACWQPSPLLHQPASATARGPSCTAAAPNASEVCCGWRGWTRRRHTRQRPISRSQRQISLCWGAGRSACHWLATRSTPRPPPQRGHTDASPTATTRSTRSGTGRHARLPWAAPPYGPAVLGSGWARIPLPARGRFHHEVCARTNFGERHHYFISAHPHPGLRPEPLVTRSAPTRGTA